MDSILYYILSTVIEKLYLIQKTKKKQNKKKQNKTKKTRNVSKGHKCSRLKNLIMYKLLTLDADG